MGVYLSKPNLKKLSSSGGSDRLRFGFSAMQGWRMTMEDAHISEPTLTPDIALFAVFDGHGGDEVAKFCEKNFPEKLKKNASFLKGDYKTALEETFLEMDVMLLKMAANDGGDKGDAEEFSAAGCTANVVLITPAEIYVANAGDSRCYLYTEDNKTVPLSEDHKPDMVQERERITKAGGYVSNGRVCDNLNLSRAIGDLNYKRNTKAHPKEQIITAFPDVMIRKLEKSCRFLIIGCDGIWETVPASDICKMVWERVGKTDNANLVETCDFLLDRLIAKDTHDGTGCDNMSLIIVQFRT